MLSNTANYQPMRIIKVEEVINSDLAKVDQWYEENRMQRNHSKYQATVMGKPKTNLEFRCENTTIPNCEEMKLLGVTMENKLKFEEHVAKICRKVSQQTAVLKRMRNILPYEIRSNIYTCFIAPHFRYCSETWHFCNTITTDKLAEKVNKRAIRFVLKDRCIPYEELLAKLGHSTLRHERIKKNICNVYRSLYHSNYPASLNELLNLRQIFIERKTYSSNSEGEYHYLWAEILAIPGSKTMDFAF
jgi:hypothetical protein